MHTFKAASIPMVLAWTGMVAFFVFGILALASPSYTATLLMLGGLILWVTTGSAIL
jgi:hypothetical protein